MATISEKLGVIQGQQTMIIKILDEHGEKIARIDEACVKQRVRGAWVAGIVAATVSAGSHGIALLPETLVANMASLIEATKAVLSKKIF